MQLKDYVKVAKFGDVVELAAPGHLHFVLYVSPYTEKPFITSMWVEKVGDNYVARDCWAAGVSNPDLEIKIITQTNNTMKITNLVKKLLDNDTRTLVKAGFINGDLALTDEGTSELLGALFLEKKDELVKIAQAKLDEVGGSG